MLTLKLQYFGHLMWRGDSLEKTDAGRDWGQEEKGTTEDEMAGWHHRLDGRESEWTPGVGDGQGGLACCDSWGCKESDTTERLNWTELNPPYCTVVKNKQSCIGRAREKERSTVRRSAAVGSSVGGGCRVEKDGVVGEKVVKTLVRLWSSFTDHIEGLGM